MKTLVGLDSPFVLPGQGDGERPSPWPAMPSGPGAGGDDPAGGVLKGEGTGDVGGGDLALGVADYCTASPRRLPRGGPGRAALSAKRTGWTTSRRSSQAPSSSSSRTWRRSSSTKGLRACSQASICSSRGTVDEAQGRRRLPERPGQGEEEGGALEVEAVAEEVGGSLFLGQGAEGPDELRALRADRRPALTEGGPGGGQGEGDVAV